MISPVGAPDTFLGRLGYFPALVARLDGLLDPVGPGGKTDLDRVKRPAPRPSWSNFRKQLDHLHWVDSLGDSSRWVEGIAATKLTDFAGEADATNAGVLRDYGDAKRIAVLAALVHAARAKARDDVAEMFCRRVATLTKRARVELQALKEQHRAVTERLIANYRAVLERIGPDGPAGAQQQAALEAARAAVQAAGGFAGQYADIDRVSAHHGDNHAPLVARHFRKDRAAMLAMAGALELEATSADRSVLQALDFVREYTALTHDHVSDQVVVTGCRAGRAWRARGRSRRRTGRRAAGRTRWPARSSRRVAAARCRRPGPMLATTGMPTSPPVRTEIRRAWCRPGRGRGRRGAADGEYLHQLGDGVVAGGVHSHQLGLLAGDEFGLAAFEPAAGAGDGHALTSAHLQQVGFELGEHRQHVEEHLRHRIGRVVDAPAQRQADPRETRVSPMSRASGTERASRSSFGTTRVSPERTAARAWSRPGRSRLVPVRPLSR